MPHPKTPIAVAERGKHTSSVAPLDRIAKMRKSKKDNRLPPKAPRPTWFLNELKLVAISIPKEVPGVSRHTRVGASGRRHVTSRLNTTRHTASYVFASVQRMGPTEFRVVKRHIGTLSSVDLLDRKHLKGLAKGYGFSELPEKITRMKASEVTHLSSKATYL